MRRRPLGFSGAFGILIISISTGCPTVKTGPSDLPKSEIPRSTVDITLGPDRTSALRVVSRFFKKGKATETLLYPTQSLMVELDDSKTSIGATTAVQWKPTVVRGNRFVATVDLNRQEVVSLVLLGAEGPLKIEKTIRGQMPSKVSYEEAQSVAVRFLRTFLKPEEIEGMREYQSFERDLDKPCPSFFWAQDDFDSDYRWGIRWVEVWVCRDNGKVVEFSRRTQVPTDEPKISGDDSKKIARAFLASAQLEATIESVTYLPVYESNGHVTHYWVVRYKTLIGPALSSNDLYIDAKTGEIGPDPALLLNSATIPVFEKEKVWIQLSSAKTPDPGNPDEIRSKNEVKDRE